ncbi:MAG: DUF2400 family protein [Bacteroidales bacterium]|nr:DUF2400 family protein [Bacteroidales bacterium]
MDSEIRSRLIDWAEEYNDEKYFREDPIAFPKRFLAAYRAGDCSLADIEVAAVFAAHFAWGRRAMIVRDCTRLFDEMSWKPYDYVMRGDYRSDDASIHRTVKWSEVAAICSRLRGLYLSMPSLEPLTQGDMRVKVFGQKPDPKAPDKKINMMRRWLVRDDGKVDLGIWKDTDPASLLIPLDVHVHDVAIDLGLTCRKQKDIRTVTEITSSFADIFPGDPCKGDFALFGYGVTHPK